MDFGFWILGTVWILHKIIATTRRLGSADYHRRIPIYAYYIYTSFVNQNLDRMERSPRVPEGHQGVLEGDGMDRRHGSPIDFSA